MARVEFPPQDWLFLDRGELVKWIKVVNQSFGACGEFPDLIRPETDFSEEEEKIRGYTIRQIEATALAIGNLKTHGGSNFGGIRWEYQTEGEEENVWIMDGYDRLVRHRSQVVGSIIDINAVDIPDVLVCDFYWEPGGVWETRRWGNGQEIYWYFLDSPDELPKSLTQRNLWTGNRIGRAVEGFKRMYEVGKVDRTSLTHLTETSYWYGDRLYRRSLLERPMAEQIPPIKTLHLLQDINRSPWRVSCMWDDGEQVRYHFGRSPDKSLGQQEQSDLLWYLEGNEQFLVEKGLEDIAQVVTIDDRVVEVKYLGEYLDNIRQGSLLSASGSNPEITDGQGRRLVVGINRYGDQVGIAFSAQLQSIEEVLNYAWTFRYQRDESDRPLLSPNT